MYYWFWSFLAVFVNIIATNLYSLTIFVLILRAYFAWVREKFNNINFLFKKADDFA